MSLEAVHEHVQVVVRTRPIKSCELKNSVCLSCLPNGKSIQIKSHKDSRVCLFTFDGSFDGRTTQEELYERCKIEALVRSVFAGYNATIFAFGQTGAGKTYTTLGPRFTQATSLSKLDSLEEHKEDGVLMRAIHDAFDSVSEQPCSTEMQIRVSCFEIYNESVTDLLNEGPMQRTSGLPVRYQADREAFEVDGLIKKHVKTKEEAFRVLSKALSSRQTRANSINNQSSRSHCITTLHVQSIREDGKKLYLRSTFEIIDLPSRYGKFSVVDLAGSERLKSTNNFDRRSIRETKAINKSLFTLGQVLWAVRCSSRGRAKEAPFRESKLTQLLWDSIRGDSKTLMIACCTPFQLHLEETLNTLKYASTAIRIKSTPRIVLDPRERLIEDLKSEIKRLKKRNAKLVRTVEDLKTSKETQFSPDHTPLQERSRLLDPDSNNYIPVGTSNYEFQIESFPELDRLEDEFHNNLQLQESASRSSLSSQQQLQLPDEAKTTNSEKSSSSDTGQSRRKSPGSSASLTKESKSSRLKAGSRRGAKQTRNDVLKGEDFRTKIIEDLNKTKAQIQKQRQQLMSKLQTQVQTTRDWI